MRCTTRVRLSSTRLRAPLTRVKSAEVIRCTSKAVVEMGGWSPVQRASRAGDIRLTMVRIVDRQRSEHNGRGRAREFNDAPRDLEHGQFVRIAEIDRTGHVLGRAHQANEGVDHVVDVAKEARLRPVAIDRDVFASKRLHLKFDTTRPSFGCILGP